MISLHERSNGAFITTIRALTDRSWVINDKGKCTIYMSLDDEKTIWRYMGQRNLICISHPKLPLWGGVIETDQDWDNRGGVVFTAWSGESLLISRTPTDGLVKASSPGALFERLIEIANRSEDLLIRPGAISKTGGAAEITLDGMNLLEAAREIAERREMEFSITPKLDDRKRLSFEAHWQTRLGETVSYPVSEGHNAKKPSRPLRISRRVVNQLTGFGEGSTTGTRPKYTGRDENSIRLYGLMEGVEDYDGVTNVETVREHVNKRLRTLRYPKFTVNVVALDVEETFEYMRLGNTFPFRSASYGFQRAGGIGLETKLRIMAMRYNERNNELEIKNQTEDLEL